MTSPCSPSIESSRASSRRTAVKISLITTSWNSAATIRTTLESVLRQRGVELEYIVTDGGSTDGTVELLSEFGRQVDDRRRAADSASTLAFRWISEPDRGMYDGINKGVRMATGDVIGILNTDDVLADDGVLARLAAEFERSAADCVFGTVRFVSERRARNGDGAVPAALSLDGLRALPTRRIYFVRFWRPWMLQWGWMPPHPAVFIRRHCFDRWGGYVPDRNEYKIAADFELLIRFFRVHSMSWRRIPLVTTVMRLGGVSTDGANANRCLNEEIVKGNRANGYRCWMWMLLPKYFIKIWEYILPKFMRF